MDGPALPNPGGAGPVVVVESRPARLHRPLDLIRLTARVGILVVLAGLAVVASATRAGAAADVARLLAHVPDALGSILRLASVFAALAAPLAMIAREIAHGYRRRLIASVLTGLLAIGIVEGLNRLLSAYPSSALYVALTRVPGGGTPPPLDAYLTALFAFAAVLGIGDIPGWRRLLPAVTAVYVISAFLSSRASLGSLVLSPVLGLVIGTAVRYLAGSVNDRPDGRRIAAELARRGFDVVRLEERTPGHENRREFLGTTADGGLITVRVFDRDRIASGAAYNVYRILRLRAELAPSPALTLERVTEHSSLLSMAATAVGVRTPRLLAGAACGPDTVLLVYESVPGVPLREPTDAQLDDLWRSVGRLHAGGITHRGLTPGAILADPDGQVVLPVPVTGAMFAGDLRISLDRAQLLITTAQLAGAERAVSAARRQLTDDELVAVLPVLQPLALPSATRQAVRRDAALLETLRTELEKQTDLRPHEVVNVERFRPRVVLSIVALLVAGYLIVSQLTSVDLVTVFRQAAWQWVPLVLLASALTYVGAALSLTGFVREKLSFPRTVVAQLAASFTGFVTPPAVGGLALNARYLQRASVPPAGIAAGLGLSQAVNAASHVVLLIGFAAATGVSADTSLPVPGWAFVALAAVAGLLLVALAVPAIRRWFAARLLPPLRQALSRLLHLLTTPSKLAQAVLGVLLLDAAYIAALWFSVRAFDDSAGIAAVAVVYLAGSAVGAVAPTPGGLGAVEVALATGLVAVGVPSTAAVSSVLLFRVATFWLPVPLGGIALRVLQRRQAV